jgi:hypothetical protein
LRRGAIETLPAPAGADRCTACKALARPPRRRLVEGGDVAILLWTQEPGAATAAPGFSTTGPKAERLGAGAARYSLVSMIHHTARGKAWPVMG